MKLELVPITRDEAQAFVSRHHRTHAKRPVGWRFGVGVACDGVIVGVAMVSNPRARRLNDGWTVEVIRVCVLEGFPNACSMLYAACWRAARALGFRRLVTYTLPDEGGGVAPGRGIQADRRDRRRFMVAPRAPARRPPPHAAEAPLGNGRVA